TLAFFGDQATSIFNRSRDRQSAPTLKMRKQPIWYWRGYAALVGIDLALAAAIHHAMVKIKPSAFRIYAPTHVEVRFVPGAGIEPDQNEPRDVIGRLKHPVPFDRHA